MRANRTPYRQASRRRGAVGLTDSGEIQTLGAQSVGIAAQSIGGGGGNTAGDVYGTGTLAAGQTAAAYDLSITVGGTGGGLADTGGSVNLTHSGGTVLTAGNGSIGLLARSIGGGGSGGTAQSIVDSTTTCGSDTPGCSAQASATLAGASASVAPFAVSNTLDRTRFRLGPSLTLTRGDRFDIRLGGSYDSANARSVGGYVQIGTKL